MEPRKIDLKIQVMAKAQPGLDGLPWADLEEMPEFHSYGEANQWLVDNEMLKLMERGLDFRIVPTDLPCVYVAALEKHVQQTAGTGAQ